MKTSPNAFPTCFIHTADWQLGKPFAHVKDGKRALLKEQRMKAVERIATLVTQNEAKFVVVAGDAFDSPTASRETVSSACSAIGQIGVPVIIVPGNHDHGGDGSLWDQEFFLRESKELAPNLRILDKQEPVELDEAIIFPCPLLRRHESKDPTDWLRDFDDSANQWGDKPRIVIAHGSVHDFGGQPDDDDEPIQHSANFIDLSRLAENRFDYIALGDWHGTKEVGAKAWYSGTPELDRFIKSASHCPGNTLVVTVTRGSLPKVEVVKTGEIEWHSLAFTFTGDESLELLQSHISELVGNRTNADLLHLQLDGSLGIEATTRLKKMIEVWESRLIRLKLLNRTALAPTTDEIAMLSDRIGDPLVASVAKRLTEVAARSGDDTQIAHAALQKLYARCNAS